MYREAGPRQQGDQLRAQAELDAPDTAEAWYLRSFTTLDVTKAMHCAKQAAKRDQTHLLAWERLAHLCLMAGDFDGALAAANELMDLGRDRLEWMMFQGYTLTKQRRYNEAVKQYTEVLALFPNQFQTYRCRALPYLCLEKHAQAIEDYSKAGALRGELSVWERYLRATPLWITGRTEEAAADYRVFRELQGQSTRADARLFLVLCEQAHLLREEDRAADAQKALKQAYEVLERARPGITPGSWLEKIFECVAGERSPEELVQAADQKNMEEVCEGYYYAGEACRLEGQIEAARNWFRKCVDTDTVFDQDTFPPDPKPEYHLARWRLSQLTGHTGPTSHSGDE
jgi:tetratricopeptide (TPR) repeat protein